MTRLAFGGNVRRTFCTLCPQHCGMLIEVDEAGHPVQLRRRPGEPRREGQALHQGHRLHRAARSPRPPQLPAEARRRPRREQVGADHLGAGARRDRRQARRDPRERRPRGGRDARRHAQGPGRLVELALRLRLRHPELRQPGPELRRRRVRHRDRRLRLGHDLPGALPGRQQVRRDLGLEPGRVVAALLGAAQGLPGAGREADRDRPARHEDRRARRPPPRRAAADGRRARARA